MAMFDELLPSGCANLFPGVTTCRRAVLANFDMATGHFNI